MQAILPNVLLEAASAYFSAYLSAPFFQYLCPIELYPGIRLAHHLTTAGHSNPTFHAGAILHDKICRPAYIAFEKSEDINEKQLKYRARAFKVTVCQKAQWQRFQHVSVTHPTENRIYNGTMHSQLL